MKHIVSYSGGMGSFAEALACTKRFGKENVLLLFADTLTEDEDLYRFLDETVAFLDCEFVRISNGMNLWELFEKDGFISNSRIDKCSRFLKRDIIVKWIRKNYGYSKYPKVSSAKTHIKAVVHLGIDYTESHRLLKVQEYMKPWVYRSLLVEKRKFIKKDFSEQFGIRRPRLYEMGFSHNNCGGFCVKAGLGHFKTLYEKLPERYNYHENKELSLIESCGAKPFLQKMTDGETSYLTMKEYREQYLEKNNAESDKFDIGGCGCAI